MTSLIISLVSLGIAVGALLFSLRNLIVARRSLRDAKSMLKQRQEEKRRS